MTDTFYEIEKRKETKKEQTLKKTNRKRRKKRKKETIKQTNCRAPPPQAMWQTLESKKLKKKRMEERYHNRTCKQSRTNNQSRETYQSKITGTPNDKAPSRERQRFVGLGA